MNLPGKHHTAYIGLGANLGNARRTVETAAETLASDASTTDSTLSRLYVSAPVNADGPQYINAVMRISTTLPPLTLLHRLQQLEQQHGRRRPYTNAPRTLDLDLILYDTEQMHTPELTLPHPRLHERAFVLVPLHELCADLQVPGHGAVSALLNDVSHQLITPIGDGARPDDPDSNQ